MKRRQFLGFLGGAAVAGPKAAQAVAQEAISERSLSKMALGMAPSPTGWNTFAGDVANDDWKISRINELKKLIMGGDPAAERQARMNRLYELEQVERARIDGLRSVSLAGKLQMLQNGAPKRNARIAREQWKNELANLMKIGG